MNDLCSAQLFIREQKKNLSTRYVERLYSKEIPFEIPHTSLSLVEYNGEIKQAGLLAPVSSFSRPSQFPSGIPEELLYYSGVTARALTRLSFSLNDAACIIQHLFYTYSIIH